MSKFPFIKYSIHDVTKLEVGGKWETINLLGVAIQLNSSEIEDEAKITTLTVIYGYIEHMK